MPGSAREEAERLVAAVLARASAASAGGHSAGDGFGLLGESVAGLIGVLTRDDWSTGSAECCVCPVCKAIAAVRDPSPETAERLAASAGDIASGVAGLMRAFSSMAAEPPRAPAPRTRPAPAPDQAWSAATRADHSAATGAAAEHAGHPAAARVEGEEPQAGAEPEESPGDTTDPWAAASAADAREAAREAAAAARARAVAAEEAVAKAVAAAKARATRPTGTADRGAPAPAAAGARTGDVWAMATTEVAADDTAEPRSVDHELGASAPEDRDPGLGDDARPGGAV
ncbi:hypothetical protein Ait01nite_033020 [Actinoplanes italicus]|uniref:Uncharacterized protein n=1 Tax=Actinoplanes italicus TaxID=113567 RepID=A0A2T0KKB1_9ACTN|nr:hypothetical protein [Actinoplanes italicus]PRX23756.1 hypothetical protein CLV67_103505 [Actinoplanes italicus]GIE30257.1 hypothetical protein Ait01nite_033020 [Actinoplanes italicus]